MYKNITSTLLLLLFILISNNLYSQQDIECNPYTHKVKYDYSSIVDNDIEYGLSYVSCFHAQGVVVDLRYKEYQTGFHMMNKGHHNTVYHFISYRVKMNNRIVFHGGPLYRVNNNNGLLIGQFGMDYKLYKGLNLTSRVLQISPTLNYLNVGLRLGL